jgi:putative nucleotidyltransferase with HDIG domain
LVRESDAARRLTGRLGWRRRRLALEPAQAGRVSAVLGAALVAGLTANLAAPLQPSDAAVAAGQPAARAFRASNTISFASELRTAAARRQAADAVPPVYSPPDPTAAIDASHKANEVLAYVELVRLDPHADPDARRSALQAVAELRGLSRDALTRLVEMDDTAWQTVRAEVPAVVSQVMRETIRPDGIATARGRTIAYVERDVDPVASSLIAQIAAGFVTANTDVDAALTEAARRAASEAVEPILREIRAGEMIAREGDILQADDIEVLEQMGLLRGNFGVLEVLGAFLFSAAIVATSAMALERLQPRYWLFPRRVALVVLLLVLFTFGARYVVPGNLVLAFAFPGAAVGMMLTVLLGLEVGLISSVILASAIGVLAGPSLEPAVYILAGSIAGSIVLGRVERFSAFFTAGAAVAVTNVAMILAFRLPTAVPDLQGLSELASAALVSAAISTGLAAVGYLTAGSVLGLTTALRLLELARPDHPLLHDLQVKAPGTYQHSIVLSNLAEAAAQASGANALLVRVGAYYHDVGKSVRPYFFVENQVPGANVHSGLDPHASARIIMAHVADGAEVARQHGLPEDVVDFIWQHHGTTQIEYFYHQAVELLGEDAVDPDSFRYPGPRPQSREAAILMLADGSEAAVRAAAPESTEEIVDVVNRIIRRRLNAGELDDSNLTLRDLKLIRESFVTTLKSLYHPRIKYPADIAPPVVPPTHDAPRSASANTPDLAEPAAAPRSAGAPPSKPPNAEEHAAAPIVEGDDAPLAPDRR